MYITYLLTYLLTYLQRGLSTQANYTDRANMYIMTTIFESCDSIFRAVRLMLICSPDFLRDFVF
jgi:hypothetical protein